MAREAQRQAFPSPSSPRRRASRHPRCRVTSIVWSAPGSSSASGRVTTDGASGSASPTTASGSCGAFAPAEPPGSPTACAVSSRGISRRSRQPCPRSFDSSEMTHEHAGFRASGTDLPQPQAPPQLPDLLHGAGRLPRRHVDAERRARLARHRALRIAARDRCPRVLALRSVHDLRSRCRRCRRPHRVAQARHGDAGERHGDLDRAGRRHAHGHGHAADRLRARRPRWCRARIRRARAASR